MDDDTSFEELRDEFRNVAGTRNVALLEQQRCKVEQRRQQEAITRAQRDQLFAILVPCASCG